jgi:hypothetical protein
MRYKHRNTANGLSDHQPPFCLGGIFVSADILSIMGF